MTRLDLDGHDAVGIRANNPGPFTHSGTNSWVLGREPAFLIDPGPALPDHLDAMSDELDERGGLGAILLTHDHPDHAEAVPEMLLRFSPSPLAAARVARAELTDVLADGDRYGPFEVLALPGHAPDHLVFLWEGVAFTGDAVLGSGSVFVTPYPGALRAYLAGLERLRGRAPAVLAPGHGPVVHDADAKLAEYIAHRLDREAALVLALGDGLRTIDELVGRVWSDAPAELRPAVELTLAAHLDKLQEEGRLPVGVQRPEWPVAWLPQV
ncbi:MAG TPA: MBL fold metallo-hydrolase [Solirubrobacteraceae bacterium]|nr:MBL fold metallo-hydrolase [Solirubrobacteraceae bacterium]